jgi:hypothetical protein
LHCCIRQILTKFDPFEPGQDWKVPVFFNWLERYYILVIHRHYDAETQIYNPAIVQRGGQLPTKITSDHNKDIIEGLDAISKFRFRIEACDQSALSPFKGHLLNLLDDIEDNLAEEETIYPQALRSSSMTEAEEGDVVHQIIQSLGLEGNKVMLPPIVYAMHIWAGAEKTEAFVNALPAPIRFAFRQCWLADFQANNLAVIAALQGTEPFSATAPACALCTVM